MHKGISAQCQKPNWRIMQVEAPRGEQNVTVKLDRSGIAITHLAFVRRGSPPRLRRPSTASIPFFTALSLTSSRSTLIPLVAATWAVPLPPVTPAPITPTVFTDIDLHSYSDHELHLSSAETIISAAPSKKCIIRNHGRIRLIYINKSAWVPQPNLQRHARLVASSTIAAK